MSFVLAGAALSKLVLATDCSDTNLEDLTETYMAKSQVEIPIGLRWFYCGGLGVALTCMGKIDPLSPNKCSFTDILGVISICHVHKDVQGIRVRIPKRSRMINRFAVCIILFCLPLVHSLNSLHLISITTGLIIWVLLLELWGMSCPDESFFGEKKPCKYTARCKISKKDLESAVKSGHIVNVSELSDRGEKGVYSQI